MMGAPETTPSGPFRRGVFVMFIVLGMLVAAILLQLKNTSDDLNESQRDNEALQRANAALQSQIATNDEDARQRAAKATAEREQNSADLKALRLLIEQVLRTSADPVLRVAAERISQVSPTPTPTSVAVSPRGSGGATPTPAPSSPGTTPPRVPPTTGTPAPTTPPITVPVPPRLLDTCALLRLPLINCVVVG